MKKGIRSDTIKILAMIFMAIDHIGACLINAIYIKAVDPVLAHRIHILEQICRIIGRIAFPIFCYQLVVGFFHTKNRKKHLLTLFIFSLLSEIPFDLMDKGVVYNPKYQNVIFTLLIGVLVITAMDLFYKSSLYEGLKTHANERMVQALFTMVVATIGSVIAELAHTDYGAKGVILIVLFYVYLNTNDIPINAVIISFLVEVAAITYLRTFNIQFVMDYCSVEFYAVLAFPIIMCDNNIRKGGKWLKWVGYLFYPCHMFIIYLIAMAI